MILSIIDCVAEICSCKHAVHLPKTFVSALMEPKLLRIFWNISNYDENGLPHDVELENVDIR